jgi:DNA helicase-2/ATP-dependent DNA helicase PcrA
LKSYPVNADKNQLAAIHHLSGPALVIAGPGSGKTTVLTNRVKHLISSGIPPSQILVLTFSKAAANEMKDRYKRLDNKSCNEVLFGTFHSVFYRFLRRFRPNLPKIVSDKEKMTVLKSVIVDYGFDVPCTDEYFEFLIREISKRKCKGINTKQQENTDTYVERIVPLYEERMHSFGGMDFEDLLVLTRDMLCENPSVLKKLQERFTYVLVDEFQDIDAVQYEILQYLCDVNHNLFAVGDDDQCIYSFRGSNPVYMSRLKNDYPDIMVYPLWNNYRCDKEITAASLRLIRHNKERLSKEIVSMSSNEGRVRKEIFTDTTKEAEYIVSFLSALSMDELINTAILLRNNVISRKLLKGLAEKGVPYSISGKKETLIDHPFVKDIRCFIRLCNSSFDREDFVRVMNKPYRGFSAENLPNGLLSFNKLEYCFRNQSYQLIKLKEFKDRISMMAELDLFGKLMYLCNVMGYREYINRSLHTGDRMRLGNNVGEDVLKTILDEAKKAESIEEWEISLGKVSRAGGSGVQIMTMHAAKGLEFERVILPDINEGILPATQSQTGSLLEEERRLLYVAMTRAKHELILLGIRSKEEYKKTERISPSRFMKEF